MSYNPTNRDTLWVDEATVTLYPANEDGSPNTGSPVWMGVCVEGMQLGSQYKKITTAATGEGYEREYIVGESHSISFERVWVKKSGQADVAFQRATDYVLVISWTSERLPAITLTRTYYRVRPDERNLNGESVYEYRDAQRFTAQRFTT